MARALPRPGGREFEDWLAAREGALQRTAHLLTGDTHSAQDLVQTTLAKLYLRWDRVRSADNIDTPIGLLPAADSLDLDGLEISDETLAHLFDVDRDSWLAECDLTEEYFAQFGDRVPAALKAELASLRYHLQHS